MHTKVSQETFEFQKMLSVLSVTAATKMKTDNRADKMAMVEESDDHYDSDISELYMLATQK
jgi:hypothetical protein